MADTAVVETPVVQTPAITPVVNPSVVETPATPETDLLTRVSQFKLPEAQEKIENPPDQPELAGITDPVAKKAAAEAIERMRRGMQSDYTKKLEEAQKLVNQSKSWTPQRIQQELLTNPEFLTAAKMIEGTQTQEPVLTQEQYSALTESEKNQLAAVPQLKNELLQIKQQAQHEQLIASITQKDLTFRQKYGEDYNPQAVNEAAQRFGKLTPAEAREYIFRADNYEKAVAKAHAMGKLEGQGKLQTKINTITPTGSNVTSQEGVPTKVAGESDKAFFVRLGQFRLNQYKNQK